MKEFLDGESYQVLVVTVDGSCVLSSMGGREFLSSRAVMSKATRSDVRGSNNIPALGHWGISNKLLTQLA
jgi:hypothetical protein